MAQSTSLLTCIKDVSIPLGDIIINPNDGYDLGLLSDSKHVRIHGTATSANGSTRKGYLLSGVIKQENDRKIGTVVMSSKLLTQFGNPRQVKFYLEGNNLIVSTVK